MRSTRVEDTDIRLIEIFRSKDNRGDFTKTFNEDAFMQLGLRTDFREMYYTKSSKGVIRGMHFQTPPFEHAKLVHVIAGEIVDVVLDIRKGSLSYGRFIEVKLSAEDANALYIPEGFAHGFKSLQDNTIVSYYVTSGYDREHDMGIRWDSFGYDWDEEIPILSERDLGFERFENFDSPFEV